ncbi:MAG TPA: hypothetical protein VEH06_16685 [Candidatus Bathyarchaeia archaeon]|nr:hypothetical protein [Candidatus Bathyarchaeia archaeon]
MCHVLSSFLQKQTVPPTKIALTSSTGRRTDKRRVQIIAIAGVALFGSILFGILVYPSSPLNALFTNTKAEVIAPTNDGKKSVTLRFH